MSFEHPGILYALLLLLIPIIIHLVRWKKFKTQVFTNVDFLQDLEIKSRKSRRLKELLVLLSRLLALAALIFAFAKPYKGSQAQADQIDKSQNIIYLDNSLSLDALKDNTSLWQDFMQDLQQNLSGNTSFTLLTNNATFRHVSRKNLDAVLQQIHLSGQITNHRQNLKKIKYLIDNEQNTLNNILYCSDMQNVYNESLSDSLFQKSNQYYFVVRQNPDLKNISIDSIWLTGKTKDTYAFNLKVSANHHQLKSPVTIRQNKEVLWRGYVDFKDSLQQNLSVHIPAKPDIEAEIKLHDKGFQFDNRLFFTYHSAGKYKILFLGKTLPSYLKKIYTPDEFILQQIPVNKLDVSQLSNYDLVILNKIDIADAYTGALKKYVEQYGNLLILPPDEQTEAFQTLLNHLNIYSRVQLDTAKVFLNRIHYKHPLFKNVFAKPVKNFAYPFVKKHYRYSNAGQWLYKLSDQSPFAQVFKRKGQIFVINTPINGQNTDFQQAASLIVPLFYQIGKVRSNRQSLYYIVGEKNQWQIPVSLKPDDILHLRHSQVDFVPFQVNQYNRVAVTTDEQPGQAGIYEILHKDQKLGSVAYNYNRKEHLLKFLTIPNTDQVHQINSVKAFEARQQAYFKAQSLWQWFLGLALLFLLIEMLLIRYWK